MFRFFAKIVAVTFLDDTSGDRIAASEAPLDQLPDTFAVETELTMSTSRYRVVRAEPPTKAEFAFGVWLLSAEVGLSCLTCITELADFGPASDALRAAA